MITNQTSSPADTDNRRRIAELPFCNSAPSVFVLWGVVLCVVSNFVLGPCCLLQASEPGGKSAGGIDPLLPPHVVIYLDDRPRSQVAVAGIEPIMSRGMTFGSVYQAVTGELRGRKALTTGTFFPGTQNSTTEDDLEKPRELSGYLKLKGYRLMMLGGNYQESEESFAYERVDDSINSVITIDDGERLAAFLHRESGKDHRPMCFIVHGSAGEKNLTPAAVLRSIEKSLPSQQTIFIYTSMPSTESSDESWRHEVLNVSLTFIWDQHIAAGTTNDSLISSIDLLPTLVEMIGGTPPSEIDGRSFASLLRGESFEHRDVLFTAVYDDDAIERWTARDARFKFVADDATGTGGRLFDLLSDAAETKDLANEPAYADRLIDLREPLRLWIERH